MTLKRTLVAHCDHREMHLYHEIPNCTATLEINSATTQPWRDLGDRGWALDHHSGDDILTYCPDHKEDAK